jgi:4-hydroxy-tetrahydrodipicolinate synthase
MDFPKVEGIIVATLTPFSADGRVDFAALDELNDFLLAAGVHGLFPCGSTGEGVFMTNEERKAVALSTLKRAAGRIPVVIHTGTLRPDDAIELTKHARDIGAAGAALIPPYYYKMNNATILEHYRTVARAVPDFPLYLYNIPSNVTNVIAPEVLGQLMDEFPNVVGIKDSSMDFMNFINFQQAAPARLCSLMGNDAQIYSCLLMGGQGGVSATATAFPETVVQIYDNVVKGNLEAARAAQDKVIKLRAIFRSFTPISAYKQVLKWRGLRGGEPRVPLCALAEAEAEKLRGALAGIGFSL